jgi:hypothetical protein
MKLSCLMGTLPISRGVDENRCHLSGLKTHDYHIIFQKLLPLVVRNILPPEVVVVPLIDLSRFFNSLCSKEPDEKDIATMSASIRETLCQLEGFFHLHFLISWYICQFI